MNSGELKNKDYTVAPSALQCTGSVIYGNEATRKEIVSKYPHTAPMMWEGGSLIVAYDDNNEIVGFLWSFRREIPAPVGTLTEDFINVIEVCDGHKEQGVGSALVQKCIEKAKTDGVYQVRAYCDIHNVSSHHLWAKNRFGISPVKMPDGNIVGSFVIFVI